MEDKRQEQRVDQKSDRTEKLEFEFMDVKALLNCMTFVRSGVDKAVQKGVYGLDETERLLVSLNSLNRSVESLEKYQNFVMTKIKQNQDQQAAQQKTVQEQPERKRQGKRVVYEDDITE